MSSKYSKLELREVGPTKYSANEKNAYIPKGHRLHLLKNNIRSQPPTPNGRFLKKSEKAKFKKNIFFVKTGGRNDNTILNRKLFVCTFD